MANSIPSFDPPPNRYDVPEWLRKVRSGSSAAIPGLLRSCQNYLMIIANRELDSDLRAKVAPSDLVQESLIEAKDDFSKFQGTTEAEVFAWLRRILLNNIEDVRKHFLRTTKRDLRREVTLESSLQNNLVSPETSINERLLNQERRDALENAILELPENYREVILLRYRDELTFEEIALKTGKSADAARKTWARAVESLRTNFRFGQPYDVS